MPGADHLDQFRKRLRDSLVHCLRAMLQMRLQSFQNISRNVMDHGVGNGLGK
ncbi:hypothetical protein [Paenibacillus naphthalenovorans]|uniref:hypothetical protein n=1 Tax=Paenibacillus naphthalenovorans TaxID=162209 RepID=UPI00136561B0|nr:hypothetical protein [Paenibacillus naphthalenovorans]